MTRLKLSSGFIREGGQSACPAQLHDLFMISAAYSESVSDLLEVQVSLPGSADPRKSDGRLYPNFYDSGPRFLDLIESLVLKHQPRIVVETGVAHGLSTRRILQAMELAGKSEDYRLHSVDIDPRVRSKELLGHPKWSFHLLAPSTNLETIFSDIGSVDLFLHDSEHSYDNQMYEYELAYSYLRPGGILLSDDISWSNAFKDFCERYSLRPLILSEAPKVAGYIVKP